MLFFGVEYVYSCSVHTLLLFMELIIELVYWNWHFSSVIGIGVCNWGGIEIAFSVVGTVVLELVFLSWNVLVIGVELKLDLI